jgi:hypothetical protein
VDEESFSEEITDLEIDFGGGRVLQVGFYPHRTRLKDEYEPPTTTEELAALIVRVVARWDLRRGGKPVPLEIAPVEETNGVLLMRIFEEIAKAQRPGETNGSS